MGYFNYFIKCIIRNISYRLCKPKVFLTVLLSVVLLFGLHSIGYCTDESSGAVTVIPSESTETGAFQYDENYLTLREMQEQIQQNCITKLYALYYTKPEETKAFAKSLLNNLGDTTSDYKGIYIEQGVDGVQFRIYTYFYNTLNYSHTGSYTASNTSFVNITYMSGNFWGININSNNTFNTSAVSYNPKAVAYPFLKVFVPEWRQMFIDFGLISTDYQSEVLDILNALIGKSETENATIIGKLEEQNQIQQEQNDFLKQESSDSDVSVDGFNSVDSNDITSDGLSGVFNNIYNSITSWSSKDIRLPIPYTNKSINIPANYTESMLNNSGSSWIVTFIHTIYYFIVSRFIIYSITNIINSIKSGSILETDSKNNITTDML